MASNWGISWRILTALHSWSYWINWKVFTTLCYLLHITWWNPNINSGNNEVRLSNSFIKIMQGLERLHVALGVLIEASCQHHKCPESYIEALQLSMLTFELSSYSLKIPNDAFNTQSRVLHSIRLYWNFMRRQLWFLNITSMPSWQQNFPLRIPWQNYLLYT